MTTAAAPRQNEGDKLTALLRQLEAMEGPMAKAAAEQCADLVKSAMTRLRAYGIETETLKCGMKIVIDVNFDFNPQTASVASVGEIQPRAYQRKLTTQVKVPVTG